MVQVEINASREASQMSVQYFVYRSGRSMKHELIPLPPLSGQLKRFLPTNLLMKVTDQSNHPTTGKKSMAAIVQDGPIYF
jgi:hypothetical protein